LPQPTADRREWLISERNREPGPEQGPVPRSGEAQCVPHSGLECSSQRVGYHGRRPGVAAEEILAALRAR